MAVKVALNEMTLQEKWELLGALWEDIAKVADEDPIPPWIVELLEERKRTTAPSEYRDLEDVERDLLNRRNQPQ